MTAISELRLQDRPVPSRETSSFVFHFLTKLLGVWRGEYPNGTTDLVTYSLTAKDNALIESWIMGKDTKAMTVYYLDGDDVFAAHYCPYGNFPRLKLTSVSAENEFLFCVHDVANIDQGGPLHQHAFKIKVADENGFMRSECYCPNHTAPQISSPDVWYDGAQYRRITE